MKIIGSTMTGEDLFQPSKVFTDAYESGLIRDIIWLKNDSVTCKECKELKIGSYEFVLNIAVINHAQWHLENNIPLMKLQ